jgi:hypothetical protein
MYHIRHLINTRNGQRLVDVTEVLCDKCIKCNADIPRIYYGKDSKSTYSLNAIYKYVTNDIIGEYSNIKKGFMPKECKKKGCDEYKY